MRGPGRKTKGILPVGDERGKSPGNSVDVPPWPCFNLLAAEVLSRERSFERKNLEGALENHFAAGRAMAGAEVHDLIRRAHHAGFVFDDDDGVAGVAQLLENADEAFGVARMQADARFVEHEERVHQPRAQAGGEIHALGLAAGERARRAVQREIAEADFVQIAEPRADFVQNQGEGIVGAQTPAGRQTLHEWQGVANGKLVEIGQV